MSVSVEPSYDEWADIFVANKACAQANGEKLGSALVAEVRREMFDAARAHTGRLAAVAREAGIPFDQTLLTEPRLESIVMAGHQPVVYHPGLLFKNQTLSRFASEQRVSAMNVVIDTDEGDAGILLWPSPSRRSVRLVSESIGRGDSIYREQVVAPPGDVATVFGRMTSDLEALGFKDQAARAAAMSEIYQKLAGAPLVIANSLARAARENRRYWELPFSMLLEQSAVKQITSRWIHDFERLVPTYNRVLDQHRIERKIKNAANPFPNMKMEGDRFELPFWAISPSGNRTPLLLTRGSKPELTSTEIYAPRGSIVTLLLRGYCSDMFIHGLGGAKYDPFVDALASSYLGVQLPRFVVASKTEYLFPEQVRSYDDAVELKGRYKEIVSHTESFLDCGFFAPDEVQELRALVAPRQALLTELKRAASGEERSAAAHRLNALNRSIREMIDRSSFSSILERANEDAEVVKTWRARELPFFLFTD